MMIWQKRFSPVALLTWFYWFSPSGSIQSFAGFLTDQISGTLAFDIIRSISEISGFVLLLEVGLAVFVFERFLRYVKNARLALWMVLLAIGGQAIWGSVLHQTSCLTVYRDAMGVNWASFQTCQDLRMIGEILFKLISAVGYLLFISELLRLRDSNDLKSVDEELSTPAEWS